MTQLIAAHLFDIGGELTPEELRKICESVGEIKKEKISQIYTDYFIQLGMTPVRSLTGEGAATICSMQVELRKYVKMTTFGAVLVEFSFDFKHSLSFEELRSAANCKAVTVSGREEQLIKLAREEFDRVILAAGGKFKQVYQPPSIVDSYRIIVDEKPKSEEEICAALLNENLGTLSSGITAGIMKRAVSYSKRDKVVVSNLSSYIYSEEYPEDFINIIELSRIQLFELKIYDTILDKEIGKTYAMLETIPFTQGILGLRLFSKSYKKLADVALELMELRIELVDMVMDVMNSTKVTDDISLAYLYRRVNEEFRLNDWYESAKAKLEELEDVYMMVIDRLDMLRSYTIEFLILVVIVLEVVIFVALGII